MPRGVHLCTPRLAKQYRVCRQPIHKSITSPVAQRRLGSNSTSNSEMPVNLSFSALRSSFTSGTLKPSDLVTDLYTSVHSQDGTFVALVSLEDALSRCRHVRAVCCSNPFLLLLAVIIAYKIDYLNERCVQHSFCSNIVSNWHSYCAEHVTRHW